MTIPCLFCDYKADTADQLREHSAKCEGHPLWKDAIRYRALKKKLEFYRAGYTTDKNEPSRVIDSMWGVQTYGEFIKNGDQPPASIDNAIDSLDKELPQ